MFLTARRDQPERRQRAVDVVMRVYVVGNSSMRMAAVATGHLTNVKGKGSVSSVSDPSAG
jgi:hypothetical protein